MTEKKEVLAIIPARGGSKGIPRKNIRLLAGYPLIAYSIAAGLQAKSVTRVLVTTDDEQIAEVARQFGASTPFIRPSKLAGDNVLDLPVFQHALDWLSRHEHYRPDAVVHLRPTTPFRHPQLVDDAVRILFRHSDADSVRAITPVHQIPYKMWLMDDVEKPIRPLLAVPGIDDPYNAPRQSLPRAYVHTGLVDVIRPATITDLNSMSGRTILPVLFDPIYDIDLDSLDDWRRAEERILRDGLTMVWPVGNKRGLPDKVDLLVLDFDGVLTDNRVWVDQDGREMVAANRSDSYGINLLRQAGVQTLVISKETNPVVAARCRKMDIPCIQGENDKASALRKYLVESRLDAAHVVYCGNDINDLPCFALVGWAVAVADALPEVRQQADVVLSQPGGRGAVRELCDRIIHRH